MFRRNSSHRFLTAFIVAVSLLFSQLAQANYACPGESDMAAMSAAMAAGEPCQGMDEVQPLLCYQHTASFSQAVEHLKIATPTLPAVVQVLVLPVLDLTALALPVAAGPEPRPPPDPLFLSTLRLRV